jgi:hypothetical protein
MAQIQLGNTKVHIGAFEQEVDAAVAYDMYVAHNSDLMHKLNWPEKRQEYMSKPLIYPKGINQTSLYTGVSRHSDGKKFVARVTNTGKTVHIAMSDNEEEMAKAYDDYIVKNNMNRQINFPERHPNYEVIKTQKEIVDDTTVKLLISRNNDILIDAEDYPKVKAYTCCMNNGYVMIKTSPPQGLHCYIMSSSWIDHIDGNPLNNKKNNLRQSSPQLNCQNQKKRKNTTSQFIGVTKRQKGWQCMIINKGRQVYSKCTETEEEAASLRDLYIIERMTESHYKLNFSWTEEEKLEWKKKLEIRSEPKKKIYFSNHKETNNKKKHVGNSKKLQSAHSIEF